MIRAQMNADFQDAINLKMFFVAYPRKSVSLSTKRIFIISFRETPDSAGDIFLPEP
jgi:hypothetical protein